MKPKSERSQTTKRRARGTKGKLMLVGELLPAVLDEMDREAAEGSVDRELCAELVVGPSNAGVGLLDPRGTRPSVESRRP
jgi:hypothetical protein